MAVTLINLTGFAWGIPSAETGLNCESFEYTAEPEINEWLPGIDGQARGKAVGDPMGKLSVKGELNTGTLAGWGLATFAVAIVPTNANAFFGRSAGGWYPDSLSVSKVRNSFTSFSGECSSRFNVP